MIIDKTFDNSQMDANTELDQGNLNVDHNDFFSDVKTEFDNARFLETKNGQNIYAQNSLLRDNDNFKEQGITLNNENVETIGDLLSSDADIGYLLDSEFSQEEMNDGVLTPGSDKRISKETLHTMRKINENNPEYFNNLKETTLKELDDMKARSYESGENSSMISSFAAGFVGYTTGKLLTGSLYDNTSLRDMATAVRTGDKKSLVESFSPEFTFKNNPLMGLKVKDPLLFAESVVTFLPAGKALVGGGRVAAQLGVEAVIDAGIEYAQQYQKGGIIDRKEWIGKSLEEMGIDSSIDDVAGQEAVLGIFMAAGTPTLLHGLGKAFKKAGSYAVKINDMRLQKRIAELSDDISLLSMIDEANVFKNKNEGFAQNEVITKLLDERKTMPTNSNLKDVDIDKSSNILNKKSSKIEGVNFETNIQKDRINITTNKKLKDFDPNNKPQVLLYEKTDGRYDILDGNKVINSTDDINGYVLREADGYTVKDIDNFKTLKKALDSGDFSDIKTRFKIKDLEPMNNLAKKYSKMQDSVNASYKSSDDLLLAYKNGMVDDNIFVLASKEKGLNQLYVAQELSKKSGDLSVALKEIKASEGWKDKKIDDNFMDIFFDEQSNKMLNDINDFVLNDPLLKKTILLEEEKLFSIKKMANKKDLALPDSAVIKYYLDQVYANNNKFKKLILEGVKNGKSAGEIFNNIRQRDWRTFGNNAIFDGKRSNNNISSKARELAEQTSKASNENKLKSITEKDTENIMNDIKAGKDKIELNGQEIDLNEKIFFEEDLDGKPIQRSMTVGEYLQQNEHDNLFEKALEGCLLNV